MNSADNVQATNHGFICDSDDCSGSLESSVSELALLPGQINKEVEGIYRARASSEFAMREDSDWLESTFNLFVEAKPRDGIVNFGKKILSALRLESIGETK